MRNEANDKQLVTVVEANEVDDTHFRLRVGLVFFYQDVVSLEPSQMIFFYLFFFKLSSGRLLACCTRLDTAAADCFSHIT